MTGVEILSSETIYNTILPEWCVITILLSVILVGFLSISISNQKLIPTILWTTLIVCCLVIAVLAVTPNEHSVDYVKYKVIIDDSVLMSEFVDHYEILDQEGKIYTVKEKVQ